MAQRKSTPITHHPLFPAIVALWFAALIGMGSFALSTSLLETLVLEGHVDSLIPAAAPPLGPTARLLLALALGAFGAALGWMLARRMNRAKPEAAPQVFTFADLDEAMPWPGVSSDVLTDDELSDHAVPMIDPRSLPVTDEDPAPSPDPAPDHPAAVQSPQAFLIAPAAQPTAAQRIASADLDTLSHVELVERLAIALQRRQQSLGTASGEPIHTSDAIVRFPGTADRQNARFAVPPAAPRPAPQETEKALREALAALQRMSGGG